MARRPDIIQMSVHGYGTNLNTVPWPKDPPLEVVPYSEPSGPRIKPETGFDPSGVPEKVWIQFVVHVPPWPGLSSSIVPGPKGLGGGAPPLDDPTSVVVGPLPYCVVA